MLRKSLQTQTRAFAHGLSRMPERADLHTHSSMHTLPAMISCFARSLASEFVPRPFLSSRPRPVSGRTLHSHRPLPASCSHLTYVTRFLAASEHVTGSSLRTRKQRHPVREVVGLLTSWTWHHAVHVHAYPSWVLHSFTLPICSRLTYFPVSCICIRSCSSPALLFPSCTDFREWGSVATWDSMDNRRYSKAVHSAPPYRASLPVRPIF